MKKVKKSKMIALLKKTLSCFMCLTIVFSVFSLTAVAEDGTTTKSSVGTSAYDKVDMDDVTGEGQNPNEITGAASSAAKKKEWYEYLTYSANPVGMYPVDDTTRILFFDPYDYTNALIMEVDESLTEWSSANEITVSYTTGNSYEKCEGSGNTTETSVESAQGDDVSYGMTTGWSKTNTTDWSHTYNNSKDTYDLKNESTTWNHAVVSGNSFEYSNEVGIDEIVVAKVGLSFGITYEDTDENGGSHETQKGTVKTEGYSDTNGGSNSTSNDFSESKSWTTVADRINNATGKSTSTSTSWSSEDSMTISTTYNATYFNSMGSPLQWKIIKYSVYLPMNYIVQKKIDNEWINVGEEYCLLRTIQGSCRSWIENNVVYYEHWGTGEAVTQNDFWEGFFTEDKLAEAYKNKLYPDN